ncbi:hypothetical protein [Microvirga subterranea]|uniref:Uncharacterized protein n=1 Tax=Microvirga subterranea TaxID=186651 RepID=A0A370H7R2_9HYPH|nr:hypothetical protein [Microvirga subterranea]RDI52422.1 hypothetical protein DES45_11547 [Microvirga subterranea]
MQGRRADTGIPDAGSEPDTVQEDSIEERLGRITAMLTAHCLLTETLIHALCFEQAEISRTRIIGILDLVYEELQGGLGDDSEIVKAFGDQRDSLRSLLIASVICSASGISPESTGG